jgi:hypothetical protein
MSILIRPVRLDMDKAELLGILQRNLPDLPHERRFEWLYHKNPAGTAWSWFACEQASGKPIGVASVFPRSMWVNGSVMLSGQVGDFAIEPTHRTLGPALLLQKATFDPVNDGTLQFCYDCPPDDRGMSTFRRLGMGENCQMRRLAKPLRLDRRLARRLHSARLASIVAFFGNILLGKLSPARSRLGDWEIALHEGRFGDEFTDLDRHVSSSNSIRSSRTAADLNWRFRDDPLHKYVVLTARRRGELAGFLIASAVGDDTYVIDLFGEPLEKVGAALVEALAQRERRTATQSLHALATDRGRLAGVFLNSSFRERELSSRVVAYTKPGSETHVALQRGLEWSFARMDLMA